MTWPLRLDADRFFPADPATRSLSRRLFAEVERVPILSPHGHCDPAWFALDQPFEDAVSLLLWPDHYILRLLFQPGAFRWKCLGLRPHDNAPFENRPARHLATLRRPLPAVSRHALTALARPCLRRCIWHRGSAGAGNRQLLFRRHQCRSREGGIPASRALRALRHRGSGDHRSGT